MARKKSKNKNLTKYSLFAIVVFTIVTVVMAFLDNVKYPAETILGDFTQKFSGFDIMFGVKKTVLNKEVEVLSFSFVAFLAYLLPLAGLITALLFNKSKILSVIPLICFIVGAILLFLMPEFVISSGESISGGVLAVGSIIAGIMNILSALCVCAKILLA